jgi:hypothetical protein
MDQAVRTQEQPVVTPRTKAAAEPIGAGHLTMGELAGVECPAAADARGRWPKAWLARLTQRGGRW